MRVLVRRSVATLAIAILPIAAHGQTAGGAPGPSGPSGASVGTAPPPSLPPQSAPQAAPQPQPAPPAPPPPPADPRVAFTGTFNFAGGPRERSALDAALEHTVQGLFFAIRPIARPRLRALNPAYASVTIRFVNGNIEMNLPGAPFFRSPENGASIGWRAEDGNPAHLSQRFDGTRIVQSIVASNGSRRNTYTLSPDGHTLTMNVYITAGQLPGPLSYTLTYRR